MVVVVIIGILVAIAIPIYGAITQRAERSTITANVRIIDGAIQMKQADGHTVEAQTTTETVNTELAGYIEPVEQVGTEEYGIEITTETVETVEVANPPRANVTISATGLEGGLTADTYTLSDLLAED